MADNVVSLVNRLQTPDELAEFREEIKRDTVQAWRTLNALSRYGFDDRTKLEATRLILAYGLGMPTAHLAIADGRQASAKTLNVSAMSDAELDALKVLETVARQRALEGDE